MGGLLFLERAVEEYGPALEAAAAALVALVWARQQVTKDAARKTADALENAIKRLNKPQKQPDLKPRPPIIDPIPPTGTQTCPKEPEKKKECPPHTWKIVSEDDPDQHIKNLLKDAKESKDRGRGRGLDFEATGIEENKKHGIETTNRVYKCVKCGQIQQVDIVFKDGQLGECKSKKAKQTRSKEVKRQAERYLDIQRQVNHVRKTGHKPLAKLDNSEDLKKTVDENGRTSKEIMKKRGYDIELLPPD
jgi:hypothetical protein